MTGKQITKDDLVSVLLTTFKKITGWKKFVAQNKISYLITVKKKRVEITRTKGGHSFYYYMKVNGVLLRAEQDGSTLNRAGNKLIKLYYHIESNYESENTKV